MSDTVQTAKAKVSQYVDTKFVVSSVVAAFAVGGVIWGLRKVGLKKAAALAKGA